MHKVYVRAPPQQYYKAFKTLNLNNLPQIMSQLVASEPVGTSK